MSNHVGSSTIYTTILPNNAALARLRPVALSREAKHRLTIIEHYLKQPGRRSVALTCRHYGITRSYFYKWYGRYNPRDLTSLESQSRRPHRVRPATYDTVFVALIRTLRTQYPRYSAKKLAVIIRRDYTLSRYYSAATIGRIIKRFKLFFTRYSKATQRRARKARATWKLRKPYGLKATAPHRLIEFDMKHIYRAGRRYYAFVAVDPFTKESLVHLATRPTSYQAMLALERVVAYFGVGAAILNDNGSENVGRAYDYLKDHGITQYFARPHTPKDKPHVENLIGKLQQECLEELPLPDDTLKELANTITIWLNDYHFFRPHQALDYQTPDEYCATLSLTIPRLEVSTM